MSVIGNVSDSRTEKNSPQVVPSDKALETSPDAGAAVVLAQLHCLVQPAIAVAEVGRERRAQMDVKAFFRAEVCAITGQLL